MADGETPKRRSFSRREFLTLAGVGAVVGAVVVLATRQSGIRGLVNSVANPRTSQKATAGTNAATAGKFIQSGSPLTQTSWLQRILGGKL